MSYQHFYSRVPARVSLYNRIDSFDTFAHSAGLDKSFILGEMSGIYADKLDIHDSTRVRRGEIPTVYSQIMLPSGRVVQSAVTYLPFDFTGERSAYLAHSLVLTDAERSLLFANNAAALFNPDMFLTDISAFNITAPGVSPNCSISEKEYVPRAIGTPGKLIYRLNPEMVKSFIYSIIASLCAGGRDVYFRLPCDDRDASAFALELINAISCVLPYSMRQSLSYVTFVSNPDSYRGFKLKCVGRGCKEISPFSGVFFDFTTGVVTGLSPEVHKQAQLLNFLYSLFENARVRDDFHLFVWRILDKYRDLVLDFRVLNEIVFIFWQCSGFYVEQSILPNDDSVAAFLDIYRKYRGAIATDHCRNAYRCLSRYSLAQTAIPQGIFARLKGLYPDEIASAKAVALDVLLSLIHVDVMREELFGFISANYDGEVVGVKAVINKNLARVFYGGFLQNEILGFFDKHFDGEPASTKDVILDKLLLTIRTPGVQKQIIAFLDRHYDGLNPGQRMKMYNVFLEMIPECDGLSVLLIALINKHVSKEGLHLHTLTENRLSAEQDRRIRLGDGRLTALLINNSGFTEEVAVRHIFGTGVGRSVYISLLAAMPAHKRAIALINVYKIMPRLPEDEYLALISSLENPQPRVLSTMYQLIDTDNLAGRVLPPKSADLLRRTVIYPAVVNTYYDVFKVRYGKRGIDVLRDYAEGKSELTDCPQYRTVLDYLTMVDLCAHNHPDGAFRIACSITDDKRLRRDISEHLQMCVLNTNTQSIVVAFSYELLINYLKVENFRFDALYTRYKKMAEELHIEKDGDRTTPEKAERDGASDAIELILTCVADICSASYGYVDIVCDDSNGLRRAMEDFIELYGIGAGLFLKQRTDNCPPEVQEIAAELIKARNANITSVREAIDLVLRRRQ